MDATLSARELHFPDRTVLLVRATVATMTRSADLLDSIAELRGAATGHNDPDLYGDATQEAVARVEGAKPNRPRVIWTTVSAARVGGGEPTSWPAAVDQLASGADSEDRIRRLIVLSAGNVMPNTG